MPFIYKLTPEQKGEIEEKIHAAFVAVIDEYGLFEIIGEYRVYHHREDTDPIIDKEI